MNRILIFLENGENRRLLAEALSVHYQVLVADSVVQAKQALPLLDEPFDLCILDGVALNHLWEWAQAKKQVEQPIFLPFLLVTPQANVNLLTRQLWQSIDDLITKPIEKLELQARVEMLLRSRQLSLRLKSANEQLQKEIAERDRAEAEREVAIAALRENEIRFRRLVESNVIGITVAGTSGEIIDANDAFLDMVGYTQEDLQAGRIRWDEMTPPEYQHLDRERVQEILSSGFFTALEKEYICKDGSRVSVQLGGALLEESQQTMICFVLDISDRKRAEAETQKSLAREREINELKSRFVSMVSHEFRNPLNLISGFVQLLERQGNQLSLDRKAEFFKRIYDAISKMRKLLEDVLIFGKTESANLAFNPAPLEIVPFCQKLIEDIKLSSPANSTLIFTQAGECQIVECDSTLLSYILTNLLSNAIKYSAADSPVHLHLCCQDGAVTLQVKDEGIGIPQEAQEHLFEAFYRANNVDSIPGTGIGLSIVKQAVNLHGGTIDVVSEVNVGTTFTVTMPIHSRAEEMCVNSPPSPNEIM
ncbi:MAG: PAS domain S-box protein [Aphanothece sp. CMT-3BRIN-NPC111]|nr:PAS domain S-box protein [Aphanothece sp. CMT-3BRIN-NPC111]